MGFSPFFFRRDKMLNRGLDKSELLRIVEAVANEKSIDKELVIGSMESAIQKAALTKFGNDNNIEVIIDRETGDIKIQKVLEIVENVEDTAREITLEDAKKTNPDNKELKLMQDSLLGIFLWANTMEQEARIHDSIVSEYREERNKARLELQELKDKYEHLKKLEL